MTLTSAEASELRDLFLRLAAVDGVSLHERSIADAIADTLRSCGLRVVEDGTGASIGGNAGNLLCFPPDFRTGEPAIVLTAHLDTVQPTAGLRPQLLADRITSDGTTILGADNRMGLSILTYLLMQITRKALPHRNFFVVHTVAEEIGLFGAEQIDLSPYRVEAAYVFDSSRRPGIYVRECVGLSLFEATFHGKAAHAGVAPEDGVNAIALAANAIATMQIGRIDRTMTTNVGWIAGGGATNIVPDRVTIKGEVRSFSAERTQERLRLIEGGFRGSMNGHGSLEFVSKVDFAPYDLPPDAPFLSRLEDALRAQGLTPQPISYTGGSDANKYNAKGIPAVNLGIGAQKPHTHEEFLLLEDLSMSAGIAFELIHPD
jgi:tripeptide aminopeptidase